MKLRCRSPWPVALALVLGATSACERGTVETAPDDASSLEGEVVRPPFGVHGDADGLLLVWFDAEGVHTAKSRTEIPLDRREHVRVDALTVAPEDRLDPDWIYLADLRAPSEDGSYPVRRVRRSAFDRAIENAATKLETVLPSSDDVIVYGASWCGACRAAERYLRERGVPFVEKDIEKDERARRELSEKARRAGVSASGIPVIDVGGTLLQGFDRGALDRLLAKRPRTL